MEVKLSASSPIWSRVRLPARHWLVQKRYSACVPADWRHAQTNMKKKKRNGAVSFFTSFNSLSLSSATTEQDS